VCEVARCHGLSPQQLFGWRRRLRDAEAASAESGGLEFVPAVVDADPPAFASGSKAQTTAGAIEVEIGDVKIRIGRGADAATLAMILRALKVGAWAVWRGPRDGCDAA
jgi:transposase